MSGNAHQELVLRRGGGVLHLGYQGRAKPGDNAFVIDGFKVARSYPVYMRECLGAAESASEPCAASATSASARASVSVIST